MAKKAYRYRFYPSKEQESLLRRTFGCCRLVYNKALAARSTAWQERKESINFAQTSKMLTAWKREEDLSFLKEVSAPALQVSLRNLDAAFQKFFAKKARYPKFKKRRSGGSAYFRKGAFRLKNGQLYLAKMDKPLDVRWHRALPSGGASVSSVTVSLDAAGRWHVSLLCEEDIQPLEPVTGQVGLDLGLTHLVTLSTGEKVANPAYHKASLTKVKRAARNMARKQKGSKNREKAKLRLARIHAKIADRRKDYLHKLSSRLIHENQVIVAEDLNVAGMVKNRRLSRAIQDAGWSELVRQLAYKSVWAGRTFEQVGRFFPSSKTCSSCGFVKEKLPLAERAWKCPACGALHDRDHNAAKNILAAGLAVTACGADVRPGPTGQLAMKQEFGLRGLK